MAIFPILDGPSKGSQQGKIGEPYLEVQDTVGNWLYVGL